MAELCHDIILLPGRWNSYSLSTTTSEHATKFSLRKRNRTSKRHLVNSSSLFLVHQSEDERIATVQPNGMESNVCLLLASWRNSHICFAHLSGVVRNLIPVEFVLDRSPMVPERWYETNSWRRRRHCGRNRKSLGLRIRPRSFKTIGPP